MNEWKAKPIVDKDFGYEVVAGRESIACVFKLGDDTHATARLIAAAPELLEALVVAMDFIDSHVADPDITAEMAQKYAAMQAANPRAAIAKATGAQP